MHLLTYLTQRYVYPLVAPPTPERLEQDKKSIDEQFEKTFALVEQLSKDTEVLKAAEQQRTERLDTALSELETVITDLKASNRRRDDEAQRVRDDVQSLKDAVPQAIGKSKDATDARLKELNTELQSLKTLITQRMNQPSAPAAAAPKTITNNHSRQATVTTPPPSTAAHTTPIPATVNEHIESSVTNAKPEEQKKPDYQDYASTLNRSSPFSSGAPPAKASIPAWQLAMAKKNTTSASSSPAATSSSADAGASGSQESST